MKDLEHAIEWLKEKGIQARKEFRMDPIEPIVFPNQAHAAVYFNDSDGNGLELIARLPFELGHTEKMYLSEWKNITKTRKGEHL